MKGMECPYFFRLADNHTTRAIVRKGTKSLNEADEDPPKRCALSRCDIAILLLRTEQIGTIVPCVYENSPGSRLTLSNGYATIIRKLLIHR